MEREKLILWRNVFLRALAIGVAFAVFFVVMTFALWDVWVPKVTTWFKMDERECGKLVMQFFLEIRIVLVFFFLVPALALHWTARKMKQ
jgi:hypothetical protein